MRVIQTIFRYNYDYKLNCLLNTTIKVFIYSLIFLGRYSFLDVVRVAIYLNLIQHLLAYSNDNKSS